MLAKRKGGVSFLGHDISKSEPHHAAKLGLGFVPEDRRVFTDLTVMENLEVGKQPPRRWADGSEAPLWTPERLFKLFPNLGEMPDRPGGRMQLRCWAGSQNPHVLRADLAKLMSSAIA